jgi:uncharacterized membrane protein
MEWLLVYAACLLTFLLVDGLWIWLIASKLYRNELDMIRPKPQYLSGVLFYLLYGAGVTAFAVLPMAHYFDGIRASLDMLLRVLVWGDALGVFAYGTFALSNQTLVDGWKLKISVLDMLWGGIVTGVVAVAGFVVFRILV